MWTVRIAGTPVPKPDPKCFGAGGFHKLSIPTRPAYKSWRASCQRAGEAILKTAGAPLDGPVAVEATFTLPRPNSHYGTGRNTAQVKKAAPPWPAGRVGDVDKLARLLLDALTDSGLWADDAQVVELTTRKTYPNPTVAEDSLDEPGATIRIWRT